MPKREDNFFFPLTLPNSLAVQLHSIKQHGKNVVDRPKPLPFGISVRNEMELYKYCVREAHFNRACSDNDEDESWLKMTVKTRRSRGSKIALSD